MSNVIPTFSANVPDGLSESDVYESLFMSSQTMAVPCLWTGEEVWSRRRQTAPPQALSQLPAVSACFCKLHLVLREGDKLSGFISVPC